LKTRIQHLLDSRFESGKNFLISRPALLDELVCTFQKELHEQIRSQSFFQRGNKLAIPADPDLSQAIGRQVILTWGLAFAIGMTSHVPSPKMNEHD
jgi:hypothetical protein